MMSKKAKHQKQSDNDELTDEERELFLDAFFQKSAKSNKQKFLKAPIVSKTKLGGDEDERELFFKAVHEGLLPSRHKAGFEPEPKKTTNKSTKTKSIIDAVLDLHGVFVEDAMMMVKKFLEREHKRGSKTLLIVHGKGSGVLKQAVWSFIEIHPFIDDFEGAPGRWGGAGALIVRINRQRKKSKKYES